MTRAAPGPSSASAPASGALEVLASGAEGILGRPLDRGELSAFGAYLELLLQWQKVQRLVGSSSPGWIVENLFLDSLLFLRVLPAGLGSVADVGTGAGFPGIPIKIVRAGLRVALIESRQRRVSFLSTVVRELDLKNVELIGSRVEAVHGGLFDAVVMRCAGDHETLIPQAARLVAPGGVVVLSGPPEKREIARAEWVEVPGVRPGRTRRFIVHTV